MIPILITKLTRRSELTRRTETPLTTEQWRDKMLAEATTADERTDLAAAFDNYESKLLAA